ncbi:hypothetical protein J6V85_03690 [Candidatus Saccharibacteria bacterium]|nr:hypothetical protein [Candidatus Saccharibacteria bacterium]
MKTDLATAIISAVVGFVVAFFVTNYFTGEIQDFTYTTITTTVEASLEEPNREVFNYNALNPTVEVFIGSCAEYNEVGECIERYSEEDEDNLNEDSETDQENF